MSIMDNLTKRQHPGKPMPELTQDVNQENDPMLDASHPPAQTQWQPLGQLPSYGQTNQGATESTPLGRIPSYDEGGDITEDQIAKLHEGEKVLNPEEAEAYRRDESSVMNNAPLSHGSVSEHVANHGRANAPLGGQMDTEAAAPSDKSTVKMNTDRAPLGRIKMDTSNPPKAFKEDNANVQEASTSGKPSPIFPDTKMKSLPGIETPLQSGATDNSDAPQSSTKVVNAGDPAAGYPVGKTEPAAPDPMSIIQHDKMAAMLKGPAGLSDLGMAMIHEKALGKKQEPQEQAAGPDLVADTPNMPQYTGSKKAMQGQEHADYQNRLKAIDQRIQTEMEKGTPEGDREAASLGLAKQHLQKMNPYGSENNHPGVLGRIEHGLAKAGNIAGDIAAPGTMELIPGTELNKKAEAEKLRGQEQAATKEGLEQAQTRVVGGKTPGEQVYTHLIRGGPNGTPQTNPDTDKPFTDAEALVVSTGTGKTPLQQAMNDLQKKVNPETGANYTPTEAFAEASKLASGAKMNEHQKRVADWVSAHKMEDTPENRETARMSIERADTEAKAQAGLPTAETKAKFEKNLALANSLLIQQNADANARGLKADELQVTENTRHATSMKGLDTAKAALDAADEEQFAAQIVPIVALMGTTSAEGIKRVNKAELDKFVPTSGSFGRWIDSHAEQFLEGKIPAEYKTEVGNMLDRMVAQETVEHLIQSQSIDGTVRQGAQQPVQKPGGGASAKPEPSKPQATPEKTKTETSSPSGFAAWKQKQQKAQ
jgi:hypothetical protein